MAGHAVGQLGREWSSKSDLQFQCVAIPMLLLIGEGLRRRARWAWVVHLLISAVLAVPGVFILVVLVRYRQLAQEFDAMLASILAVALGAAAQIPLLLTAAVRAWLRDRGSDRARPWPLLGTAGLAFIMGLGIQIVLIAHDWGDRSDPDLGLRVRMPNMTQTVIEQRQDELGGAFDAHRLAADVDGCSYSVLYGRLPPSGDGRTHDPREWRDKVLRDLTAYGEALVRNEVRAVGAPGIVGDEVRFSRDGVTRTVRVFTPLPRFVVMEAFCQDGSDPPRAKQFFESLRVYPR
jgi:hypothetical protein